LNLDIKSKCIFHTYYIWDREIRQEFPDNKLYTNNFNEKIENNPYFIIDYNIIKNYKPIK
jgi:hypothetical protein